MLARSISKTRTLRKTSLRQFSAAEDQIGSWMKKVKNKVSTTKGRNTVSKLSALMSHYNKASVSTEETAINWEEWEGKIQTQGFVSRLKDKFEALDSQEYRTEKIMENVNGSSSQAYANMNSELEFHSELWFQWYLKNRKKENDLNEFGCAYDVDALTYLNHSPKEKAFLYKCMETGNESVGNLRDVNHLELIMNQFEWGRVQTTFYKHPNDDYCGVRATKNIMGQ